MCDLFYRRSSALKWSKFTPWRRKYTLDARGSLWRYFAKRWKSHRSGPLHLPSLAHLICKWPRWKTSTAGHLERWDYPAFPFLTSGRRIKAMRRLSPFRWHTPLCMRNIHAGWNSLRSDFAEILQGLWTLFIFSNAEHISFSLPYSIDESCYQFGTIQEGHV